MTRVRTKICGITNIEDALHAIEAGADALGFVFYPPSPRAISPADAARICAALPPFVAKVALFVNPEPDLVRKVLAEVSVDHLQFHGDESQDFCLQFSTPWYRAVRVSCAQDIEQASMTFPLASALLLDAFVAGVPGGTGQRFNWQWLADLQLPQPIIVAGGLHPDNVAQAIAISQPYAVDVSGGVEQSKGKKCKLLMRQFIANTLV